MAEHFNLPPNELVDENQQPWQVVMIYDDEIKASIAKGALEAEEIPVAMTNQTFNSVLPVGAFNGVGGVRLWVPNEKVDEALMILRRNDDMNS